MAPAFNILVLAVLFQGCLSDTLVGEPFFDPLNTKSGPVFGTLNTKSIPPVFGTLNTNSPGSVFGTSHVPSVLDDIKISNKEYHVADRYVKNIAHPEATGEILGKQVETFAIGQKQPQTRVSAVRPQIITKAVHTVPVTTQVVAQPVQTQLVQQVVPVQTVQVVQQPQYQVIRETAPQVLLQREVVEVEKPVPVPVHRPVHVAEPPKPYVKEAVYARPFQVAQPYVKTRITPFKTGRSEEKETPTTPAPTTTTTQRTPKKKDKFEEVIEEHLYYVNKKKKIVTKFIKIVDVYEADTTEEIGTYYRLGELAGDNFDLQVTQIYEADKPFLVSNSTTTKQVLVIEGHPVPPKHLIFEYENNVLVHSYPYNKEYGVFGGVHPSKTHFDRFHRHGSISDQATLGRYEGLSVNTYTFTSPNGKLLKATERSFELPGGYAIFIEKRVTSAQDDSPFPADIKPIPSFEEYFDKAKGLKVQKFVLTYDATAKQTYDSKYGFSAQGDFLAQFKNFLDNFEESFKYIPEHISTSSRSKRSTPAEVEYEGKNFRKIGSLTKSETRPGGDIYQSADGEKIKLEQEHLTQIRGPPRNEYLRYGKIYVPRKKVKYETVATDYLGDHGYDPYSTSYNSFGEIPYDIDNYSYRYGSPSYRHPFLFY